VDGRTTTVREPDPARPSIGGVGGALDVPGSFELVDQEPGAGVRSAKPAAANAWKTRVSNARYGTYKSKPMSGSAFGSVTGFLDESQRG
jgi:hypothetical protein